MSDEKSNFETDQTRKIGGFSPAAVVIPIALNLLKGMALLCVLAAIDFYLVMPLKLYKATGTIGAWLFRAGEWAPLITVLALGLVSRSAISVVLFFVPVFVFSVIYSELIFGIAYLDRSQGFGVSLLWSITYFVGCAALVVYFYGKLKCHTNSRQNN